jgi:hypothetical protein
VFGLITLLERAKGLIILPAGGAIALYGPVGPTCAPYSVTLDGGTPSNYSATKPFYRPQQLLYHAGGLGKSEHTLIIQSEAWSNSALYLAIDYAQIFSTSSLQGGYVLRQLPKVTTGLINDLLSPLAGSLSEPSLGYLLAASLDCCFWLQYFSSAFDRKNGKDYLQGGSRKHKRSPLNLS